MRSWLVLVLVLAGCDRVLGLERPCDEEQFGSTCSTCGGIGQACCASATTCGDGLFCGDGTCSECVIDVAPGRRHMCALRYDNTVWCSGQNESAQRGSPGSEDRVAIPVQVKGADGQPFGDVVSLGSGRNHSCAVRRDGTVWCWGRNSQGQLGDGAAPSPMSPVPTQVIDKNNLTLKDAVAVRAGYCHGCALRADKTVTCWGCGSNGELGDGALQGRPKASPVLTEPLGPRFADVAEISAGHEHTCLRTTAGAVWCWGHNQYGQIGNGTVISVVVPTKVLDNATSIGAGSQFTCATKSDGTVWCWGRASGDRIGDGNDELPEDKHIPTQVLTQYLGAPFTGSTQVSVGTVGCVIIGDTGVWCWGKDQYGTTGGGGSTVPAPALFTDGAQLADVDRLVGHYAHTCAHQTTGRYVCWGRNTSGQLANGTYAHTGRPATVQLTCP